MTTSMIPARRKRDPQHYAEGKKEASVYPVQKGIRWTTDLVNSTEHGNYIDSNLRPGRPYLHSEDWKQTDPTTWLKPRGLSASTMLEFVGGRAFMSRYVGGVMATKVWKLAARVVAMRLPCDGRTT